MTPAEQAHLRILRIVGEAPQISQRQLAERLGVSLGKANYLLKALFNPQNTARNNIKKSNK